jgi:ectoine hydroxylase-related dioxygenase (phytanoyl-CoA dioxygenase family)
MVSMTAPPVMTEAEIAHFRDQGFAGPYRAFSEAEMAEFDARLTHDVFLRQGPCKLNPHQSRHLDSRVVFEMCSHPAIVERMAAVYGPDLVLWRSNFFCKDPGGKEIPWHQDLNYWPLEPVVNITAWLAVDAATRENSCVQFIPGSHKRAVPHIPSPVDGRMEFGEMADPAHFDVAQAVDMELRPGEFVLFNEKTLHHSEPNRSQRRRLGLAVRVTIPIVKVDHDQLFPGHTCILLRGEDRLGLNRLSSPPTAG